MRPMIRPVARCTPALLAMIATDWSVPELRAAIACLIDLLDARTAAESCILPGRGMPQA